MAPRRQKIPAAPVVEEKVTPLRIIRDAPFAQRLATASDHLVPLSPQVVKILSDIRAMKLKGPYLFPYPTKSGVISENRMITAFYRLGYHGRATVHGMRTLASTVLNESNLFQPDWIEMQLSHVDSSVRGVYNAAQWLGPRRDMMNWYSTFLDRQREVAALL
jgi:integrase